MAIERRQGAVRSPPAPFSRPNNAQRTSDLDTRSGMNHETNTDENSYLATKQFRQKNRSLSKLVSKLSYATRDRIGPDVKQQNQHPPMPDTVLIKSLTQRTNEISLLSLPSDDGAREQAQHVHEIRFDSTGQTPTDEVQPQADLSSWVSPSTATDKTDVASQRNFRAASEDGFPEVSGPHLDAPLLKFMKETEAREIDSVMLTRFERVTGHKPHRYLRRGIIFCHRDLDRILYRYERNLPIYLFTGRGPSSDSLHIGHSIPFEFTSWLQNVFRAKLVIMLTDDMKLLHNKKLQRSDVQKYTVDNAKDILAFHFDPQRTFMFSNLDYVGGAFYQNIISIARCIQVKSIKNALHFEDEHNVGMFFCCSTQSAGCLATSFPGILSRDEKELRNMACMIGCSFDIDGYFSEIRKHAPSIGFEPPAFLYSSLLPSLQGGDAKMSASDQNSAIFLTDSPGQIRQKLESAYPVNDFNPEVPLQWLNFFLEDDNRLADIHERIESSTLSAIELRETLIETIQGRVEDFQYDRSGVTDGLLNHYMTPRLLR